MIDCDGESLVSSGVDHLVIVWRVSATAANRTIELRAKLGGISRQGNAVVKPQ